MARILRIIALVPVYAVLCFLAASFPHAATYLEPWTDAYESVALASFFLLIVTYITPVPETREAFFSKLETKDNKGNVTSGNSTSWYHVSIETVGEAATYRMAKRIWIFVFQYIVVSWIVAVATDASQAAGTYCLASNSVHFAHLWVCANFPYRVKTLTNIEFS